MLDAILNNPHYIIYAMIAAFVIVVVFLIIAASGNMTKPPADRHTEFGKTGDINAGSVERREGRSSK